MRVRDHLALSTAGAALLEPWLGRGALGWWAGAVLIDADHYAWFCVRQRCCHPVEAVRFFNAVDVPQRPGARLLHTPTALALALLLAAPRRWSRLLSLGMAAHVALDAYHERRMGTAREAALRRDEFACQGCGSRSSDVGTHLWRQPRLLPSYGTRNLVSLCAACHRRAHVNGMASWN